MFKYRLAEIEHGDVDIHKGIKTQVTSTDPESRSTTWNVSYGADLGEVIGKLNGALDILNKIKIQNKQDHYFSEVIDDIKYIRNEYRSHIRNNYPDEYEVIKRKKSYMKEEELDEESTSSGAGEYNTPFAFNKNKNANGTTNIKVYKKYGYRLAPHMLRNSKQLFEDEL